MQRWRLDLVKIEQSFFRKVVAGELTHWDDVAKAVGVSRSTVSRFIRGATVSIAVALAVLRLLDLTFEDVHTAVDDASE
jgi:DNA-binding XRE family transcriptional regulator